MSHGREDLRVAVTFFAHVKTKRLRKECGDAGIVSLLKAWAYAAQNFPGTGKFARVEDVEEAAEWDGSPGQFIAALRGIGWLDEDGLTLHDWVEEQPYVSGKMERVNDARVNGRIGGLTRAKNAASKALQLPLQDPSRVFKPTLASPSSGLASTLKGLQPPVPSLPVPSLPDLTQPKEGGGPPSSPPPLFASLIQTAADLAVKLSAAVNDDDLAVCQKVITELLVSGVTEEFLCREIAAWSAPIGAFSWKGVIQMRWNDHAPAKARNGEVPYVQPDTGGAYLRKVAAEREAHEAKQRARDQAIMQPVLMEQQHPILRRKNP